MQVQFSLKENSTPCSEPANWHKTEGGSDANGFTYFKPTVDRGYMGHQHFNVGTDFANASHHKNMDSKDFVSNQRPSFHHLD